MKPTSPFREQRSTSVHELLNSYEQTGIRPQPPNYCHYQALRHLPTSAYYQPHWRRSVGDIRPLAPDVRDLSRTTGDLRRLNHTTEDVRDTTKHLRHFPDKTDVIRHSTEDVRASTSDVRHLSEESYDLRHPTHDLRHLHDKTTAEVRHLDARTSLNLLDKSHDSRHSTPDLRHQVSVVREEERSDSDPKTCKERVIYEPKWPEQSRELPQISVHVEPVITGSSRNQRQRHYTKIPDYHQRHFATSPDLSHQQTHYQERHYTTIPDLQPRHYTIIPYYHPRYLPIPTRHHRYSSLPKSLSKYAKSPPNRSKKRRYSRDTHRKTWELPEIRIPDNPPMIIAPGPETSRDLSMFTLIPDWQKSYEQVVG